MFHSFLVIFCCFFSYAFASNSSTTNSIVSQFELGDLVMEKLLESAPALADATTSSRVHPEVLGQIINYNDERYEIRVESFEDTTGLLPAEMSFRQYIQHNHLLSM